MESNKFEEKVNELNSFLYNKISCPIEALSILRATQFVIFRDMLCNSSDIEERKSNSNQYLKFLRDMTKETKILIETIASEMQKGTNE